MLCTHTHVAHIYPNTSLPYYIHTFISLIHLLPNMETVLIYTFTYTINLTHSCEQMYTYTHTYTPINSHSCINIYPPTSIPALKHVIHMIYMNPYSNMQPYIIFTYVFILSLHTLITHITHHTHTHPHPTIHTHCTHPHPTTLTTHTV